MSLLTDDVRAKRRLRAAQRGRSTSTPVLTKTQGTSTGVWSESGANATATAPRPRQASYVPRGPTLTSLPGMMRGACVIAALVGIVCAATPAPTRTLAVRGDEDKLPAGGLTITEPAQTAQASYYKIAPHETITFGWNFTSLKATPTRLYLSLIHI